MSHFRNETTPPVVLRLTKFEPTRRELAPLPVWRAHWWQFWRPVAPKLDQWSPEVVAAAGHRSPWLPNRITGQVPEVVAAAGHRSPWFPNRITGQVPELGAPCNSPALLGDIYATWTLANTRSTKHLSEYDFTEVEARVLADLAKKGRE